MNNVIDLSKLINTTEAALRLGVGRRRLLQFIEEGRLPAVKAGRDWLIDPKDLKMVAGRKVGRPKKKKDSKPTKSDIEGGSSTDGNGARMSGVG